MIRCFSTVFLISIAWSFPPAEPRAVAFDTAAFIAALTELDSLLMQTDTPEIRSNPNDSVVYSDINQLSSSGTVFRSMDMSPLVGSDLGGGLKLQFNGNLTDDIQVSGVLSDQKSPIQPQGNTRTIRDLDEVYLKVTHPKMTITAGDYILRMNSGKLLNINKNLIGIKSSFKSKHVSGSAFFAGAKGNYRELKIKGEEGNQGPYMLSGNGDYRNQTIVAGSESVWLDGKKLVRGSQYDYTIDYSTGELSFEPKHLLHSDSDIFVEYESTDSHYRRNTVGSSLSLKKNGRFLEINWIRDFDDPSSSGSGYSTSDLDLLKNAGDASLTVSGAVEDSSGLYVLENDIYVYDPTGMEMGKRYKVTFALDREFGTYKREFSADGTLYYTFVSEDERTGYIDLYSASKTIFKPENINMIQMRSGIPISQNQFLNLDVGLSQYDKNRLSAIGDDDNVGNAFLIALEGNKIHLGNGFGLDYSVSNRQQGSRYHSLTRDKHVSFSRNWNMTGAETGRDILSEISGNLQLPWDGNFSSSYSQYSIGRIKKNRFQSGLETKTKWMPELKAAFNRVKGEQNFSQQSFFIKALPGSFHPYVNHESETREKMDTWETFSGGIEWSQDFSSFKLGMGRRKDFIFSSTHNQMDLIQKAVFGELDFSRKTHNGWTGAVQIRKRITENSLQNSESNISLAHIRTHFRKKNHPIRFDLKLKQESRLGSGRAMVYDSVGAGFGGYRYDEEFDAFIEDPNGSYSGFAVSSGTRRPVKAIRLMELFEVDFNRTRFENLKGVKLRINVSADVSGLSGNLKDWMLADIGSESVERSRWMARTELSLNPSHGKRQNTLSWLSRRDLNALDIRGADFTEHREITMEWKETVDRYSRWTVKAVWSDQNITSSVSSFRNRSVVGKWLETGFEWKINPEVELNTKVTGGSDSGMHQSENFSAKALGLRVAFIKRIGLIGRLRGEIILNESWMAESTSASLPPEALLGFALGKTFRSQLTAHFLFANSMSMNLSINTISDSRYDNLINLRGEIRANF